MSSRLSAWVVIGWFLAVAARAGGQELLTNPSLELVFPDVGGRYTVAPGWRTVEGPEVAAFPDPDISAEEADYNDNGIVDAADYVVWRDGGPLLNESPDATPGSVTSEDYDAWAARFGNGILSMSEPSNFSHLSHDGFWQHWFQPYYASFAEVPGEGFAHLYQDVPGTPGLMYTMTGYSLFEAHYAGGRDNLNQSGTDVFPPDDGPPSPTDSFFALEFLDANNEVLAGSVEKELKADGQMNDTTWRQHTLSAVAPAGTVTVRVRASMVGAILNPNADPQSFFVDLFSLTATSGSSSNTSGGAVPEPSAAWMAATALGVWSVWRRQTRAR